MTRDFELTIPSDATFDNLPEELKLEIMSYQTFGEYLDSEDSYSEIADFKLPQNAKIDSLNVRGYSPFDFRNLPFNLVLKWMKSKDPPPVPLLPRDELASALQIEDEIVDDKIGNFIKFREGVGGDDGTKWGDRVTQRGKFMAPYGNVDGYIHAYHLNLVLDNVDSFLKFREGIGGATGARWGDRLTPKGGFVAPYGDVDAYIRTNYLKVILGKVGAFLQFREGVGGDDGAKWGDRLDASGGLVAPYGNVGGHIQGYDLDLILGKVDSFLKFREGIGGNDGAKWGDRWQGWVGFSAPYGDPSDVISLGKLIQFLDQIDLFLKSRKDAGGGVGVRIGDRVENGGFVYPPETPLYSAAKRQKT
jgi:hypothetical protein